MNGGKAFFDTNVLLYMYSGADAQKRGVARDLFHRHTRFNLLLLSTQVVQEFYAAGSRKLAIPRREMLEATAALLQLPLVTVGPQHIAAAIETEDRYKISFWDALILSAAAAGGAELLYTEDLNDGQQYGGVIVRNPFR
jgi:predicted nucleic acid-binding protein